MTIGVIVAMRKELELLLPQLDCANQSDFDGFCFYCGKIGDNDIVAMQCGIGKVNAAMGALTLINHFAPHYVINTGVAGGADPVVNVMDVVVGTQVAYHDVWCGPESPWGAVQGLPLYYDGSPELVAKVPAGDDIKFGLICSGDQFIDSIAKVDDIKHHFPKVLAVDMESAAIAQVCHTRGVKFLSMRIISDSPGASHNNTKQYHDFWVDAPRHSFDVLVQLLK